jgi:fatty acid desaturase
MTSAAGPADPLAPLRREIRARGWDRKATGPVLRELGVHLATTAFGLVLFLACESLLVRGLGFLLSIVGSVGVGSNCHTSSHYATSERRWVNETLTYFGLPLFLQLSATYWWHKHLVRHHPAPNVAGLDIDIDLWPWLAMNEDDLGRSAGARRTYYRYQWLLAPLAVALNGFSAQLSGWRHLLRSLRDPCHRRLAHMIDLVALLGHWALWVGAPLMVFAWSDVLLFYGVRTVGLGYAFFAVLAPAHFPAEAVVVRASALAGDFVRLQTEATVNFRTGPLGRLVCSGLEYQIEHHLFPAVSHVHYPALSRILREFCEREGYAYRSLAWSEALWKSLRAFHSPKPVQGDQ